MKLYDKQEMDKRIEDYLIYNVIDKDYKCKPVIAYKIMFGKEDELIGVFNSINDAMLNLRISTPSINKSLKYGVAIKGYIFKYPKTSTHL